jgi:hypothetical protein
MNLLLEGDDLEALLLRAHREGGTSARIVRAEKVRRGGVLGFFAREGFEVAVEIAKGDGPDPEPDYGTSASDPAEDAASVSPLPAPTSIPTPTPAPATAPAGPTNLLELAERTSAAERAAVRAVALQAAYAIDARPQVVARFDPLAGSEQATTSAITSPIQAEPLQRTDLPIFDGVPAPRRATFAPIEFPKAEVPEHQPWPQPTDPLASEWSGDLLTLNEMGFAADVAKVTNLSEASEATAGSSAGAASSASDAQLWFNTGPAVPAPRPDPDSLGTGSPRPQFTQLIDHLREGVRLGRHRSEGSRRGSEQPITIAEDASADDYIDEDADDVHHHNKDHDNEDHSVDEPLDSEAVEQAASFGAHHLELSMSGGIPPVGTGTPRATTVVPRRKPRRGGSSRSLPVPRPATHDEPDAEPITPTDSWIADESILRPDDHEPIDAVLPDHDAELPDHDAELPDHDAGLPDHDAGLPNHDAEPATARTSSDAAWRLLRGWRPGGRRRAIAEDDTAVLAPEIDDFEPARAVAPGPFTNAATQGAVPAASAVIGSIDQLATDREALRTLGVPAAWTRHLDEGDRFTSIVSMLGRLAELKINDDVAVIAVIGPADVVELEAHRTALDLPVEGRPRAVAVIPAEAGIERRAAIARSKRIRPVVVSLPIEGYDDPAGTRKILAGVQAGAVIAVVDARRPLEEITRWVEALERVDAIALDGALDVECPAAVLALDVPVIRVDGIAVDRIGWAALLCAQLSAVVSPR